MRKCEFLIVGQGISGTTLAFKLIQSGRSIIVIDKDASNSASAVSSGLINPITGRNYGKSRMIDDLLPIAHQFYQELSDYLGVNIVNQVLIHRHLSGAVDENLWLSQSDRPDYSRYMSDEFSVYPFRNYLKDAQSFATVKGGLKIDAEMVVRLFRERLLEQNLLIEHAFVHDLLESGEKVVKYLDVEAQHIIFAEGAGVLKNPYFNELPFQPARGEVAICAIPSIPNVIVKYKKFLIPLGNQRFWVGSTYNWDLYNAERISHDSQLLQNFLESNLKCDFKVLEWKAGIRPATKFRRPLIGSHHTMNNVYLFNGLGTKGMSLAPYWAQKLLDHITTGKPLESEVHLYDR